MQSLKLNEEKEDFPKGFWRRQFQTQSTKTQIKFDWIFGVVLPVICFFFDPIVFKGNGFGAAYLGTFKPFAYVLSFVSVMAMSAWLIWGGKLKWLNALLAGLFAVGGLISLGIGILIAPISLFGLIIVIGILGFTPLFTSIVYLRNALRAFQTAKPFFEKKSLIYTFVLSALLSVVAPYVLNANIKNTLNEMAYGDAQTIRAGAERLKYVAPLVNLDILTLQYHRPFKANQRETEKMEAIGEAYKIITGEDIETKADVLMD